jgi:Xaa-Pro aminopeptidase
MLSGELVRADVGCMAGGYGGDAGRTVPVSGSFTPEQSEVWDLLVTGYLAGVDEMRAGGTLEAVRDASRAAIENAAAGSPTMEPIADAMNGPSGVDWHVHSVGIKSAEQTMSVLEAGSVIAYEPMFSYGNDAYYLEDMILIGEDGVEILTTHLPYRAKEMAEFLSESR